MSQIAAKRAATKRRAALSATAKLPSEQRQQVLRQMHDNLSAQATKSEQAAHADEKQAKAAVGQAEAAQTIRTQETGKAEKFNKLLATLQERHRAVVKERTELLDEDARVRDELSVYFQSTIDQVTQGLKTQGTDRSTQSAENQRIRTELISLAGEYEDYEKQHAALLATAKATQVWWLPLELCRAATHPLPANFPILTTHIDPTPIICRPRSTPRLKRCE